MIVGVKLNLDKIEAKEKESIMAIWTPSFTEQMFGFPNHLAGLVIPYTNTQNLAYSLQYIVMKNTCILHY